MIFRQIILYSKHVIVYSVIIHEVVWYCIRINKPRLRRALTSSILWCMWSQRVQLTCKNINNKIGMSEYVCMQRQFIDLQRNWMGSHRDLLTLLYSTSLTTYCICHLRKRIILYYFTICLPVDEVTMDSREQN